jgi:teichuronic acid biosynthesis glycosyltransferase TuaC
VKVLAVTSMYPTEAAPGYGIHVYEQVESLRALGLGVDVLTIGGPTPDGRRHPGKYVRALIALQRRAALSRPDVIHAHYGLSGAIASVQRRAPVVTTFHGSDTGYIRWQGYLSWLVARVTTPIFVAREGAVRLGVPGATVIPCGVDIRRFRPMDRGTARRLLGWNDSRRYVLLPGPRNQLVKRADLFDAAVARVRLEVNNVVGVALERTPREKVPLIMNAADVTLMTSDSEGSPVTIKESLACLTPVVSVPVGDVAQLIDGLPGCAVASRGAETLGRAVIAALGAGRSPQLRERVVAHSQERVAQRLVAVYESLVRGAQ